MIPNLAESHRIWISISCLNFLLGGKTFSVDCFRPDLNSVYECHKTLCFEFVKINSFDLPFVKVYMYSQVNSCMNFHSVLYKINDVLARGGTSSWSDKKIFPPAIGTLCSLISRTRRG